MIGRVSAVRVQNNKINLNQQNNRQSFGKGFRIENFDSAKPVLHEISINDEIAKLFQATKDILSGKLKFRTNIAAMIPEEGTACKKQVFLTENVGEKALMSNKGVNKPCDCLDIVENGVPFKFFRDEDGPAALAYDQLKRATAEFSE